MNAKETLYRYALENLNHLHDGDEVFESVCHEVVKYSLPSYQFTKPSGGNGPRDGGRDGFDANKNCRMACAIRVDYEKKLDEEIGKCKQESELFFFSNQKIPETQKIKLEEKYKSKIKLKIFSWADLSESIVKISKSFEFREIHAQIDDLLDIQKITYDYDCPNFNIKPQKVECEGNVYKSKIIVKQQEGSSYRTFCGINPLISYFDFAFHGKKDFSEVQNCYLKGVFGIGKTTSIKLLYNSFLTETEKEWAKSFFPLYYSVRNYPEQQIKIPSTDNNFICFLDGIDEISDEKQLKLLRTISNYINSDNVRFVLSGRDGGFNSDTESFFGDKIPIIKIIPYLDPDDLELVQLQNKLKNTPLERMVLLPIFRSVLSREKNICDLTPKKLYDLVVLDPLKKDCLKYNQSIDCVDSDERESFFNKVVNEFSYFCYEAFCHDQSSFSRDELKKYFSADTLKYICKSILLDFQSPESIAVHNYFYYEYFVANYLSDKCEKIKSTLMTDNDVDSKKSNVLRIVFDISSDPISLSSHIVGRTSELSKYALLLKIKYALSDKDRFDLYLKIYEYFSQKGRLIYYVTFGERKPRLKDIDSLAEELYELLPEPYYANAVDVLLNDIRKDIKPFDKSHVVRISNAIVLLGVWRRKIWNQEQQEKIKACSESILSFLLENKSKSHVLNGFLSESIVLSWYKTYEWTIDWEERNWNDFLKLSFPNTQGFGSFVEDEEYHFQLELFNEFSDDKYIKQLAKPLCVEVMKRSSEDISIAGYIPEEIDDEFKTPVIRTDSEIYGFISILKENALLSADDVVDIIKSLINAHVLFHSTNYEFVELKKLIRKTLQSQANALSLVKCKDLYEIIACSMDDSKEFPLYEFESCLRALPDQIKYDLLNKIIQNLNDTKWERNWNFCNLISILLDVYNGVDENLEFVQQNIQKDTYNRLISRIYWNSDKSRSLYQYVKSIYEKDFAAEVEKQAEKEKLLSDIRKKNEEKLANEGSLLINPSAIIEEINAVEEFMKKHTTNGVPDYDFHDLDYETIENNIRHEINFKCKHTPIFSDFVVKLLNSIRWRGSYLQLFTDVKNLIKEWFSNEKTYWVCFYNCYVQTHSDEEVKKFLDENKGIKKKIIESMANDVVDLQKQLDERLVVSLSQKNWITPFVKYIHIILDGKIPEYIDRNKLLLIIAYPSKFLVSSSTFFKNPSAWGDSSSSFDWLHDIAGFKHSEIVGKALELYPLIDSLYIKAQILSGLVKHLNCQENEIIKIIIDETKHVFEKIDSPEIQDDLRFAVLPEFWQNADKKYLSMIYDFIPFEKYGLRLNNPCLSEVIAYALKYMTVEQKKQLIAKHESSLDPEIRELMRRLGSKKEILRKISEYLNGGKCDSHFGYSHAYSFGFLKKDIRILWAYCRLFNYSMKKNTERRSALATIASKGIKEHIGPFTFKFFKFYMNCEIRQRIKAGLYVEWLYDFMDEIEQKIYSR